MRFSIKAATAIALAAASCADANVIRRDNDTFSCELEPVRFEIDDAPYSNYFYSDCHSQTQVVVTSPEPDSNLTLIGPRLLVAWPAGNSGIAAFFAPQDGVNGSLAISLEESDTTGNYLDGIFELSSRSGGHPEVGVTGHLRFNSSASLTIPILGSVRTIREFTEGPSLLTDEIQDGVHFSQGENGVASLSRRWFDNVTTTTLSFAPAAAANSSSCSSGSGSVTVGNGTLDFLPGTYAFSASFDYPQLDQLSPENVLNENSQGLIDKLPVQVKSLSFLSYSGKLLAGAWRFLTYFGRDSMISMLLMEPILSTGEAGALEGGIGGVLERIDRANGATAHEEALGDYATYEHLQEGSVSTAPIYDYKMIDTVYFVPVVLADYLVKNPAGHARADSFLGRAAGEENPNNAGLTYRDLALLNAEKIMHDTAPFAARGGQVRENLIRLEEGEVTGEWRDSTYGLGGGRIPYNVNAAIVPAGLRAIAALAEAGFFPEHSEWADEAARAAKIWEDETLRFFEVTIEPDEARALLDDYVESNGFAFPSQADTIGDDEPVTFYGLALEGHNDIDIVRGLNTDDCFRHFLLNTTDQAQLSSFLSQTADHILRPYPAGLTTDVGLLVANPAYGDDPVYAANFTNSAYHGTVVWSWQIAMMAAGLERQLGRCVDDGDLPDFCADEPLRAKVLRAYDHLWDVIEANEAILSSEVWSWRYVPGEPGVVGSEGSFVPVPLGDLPPPDGVPPTESNANQLWSLTFLAVTRNENLH